MNDAQQKNIIIYQGFYIFSCAYGKEVQVLHKNEPIRESRVDGTIQSFPFEFILLQQSRSFDV